MDRIKVLKMGSLELIEGIPELNKDYLLSIRVSRSGIEVDEKDDNDHITYYVMKYLHTEAFQEIGTSKKLKVQKGTTQSQKLRFVLEDIARAKGVEEENFYKETMGKIISHYEEKLI